MRIFQILLGLFFNILLFFDIQALYLFDAYPELKNKISYERIGNYPTPVYNMKSLAAKYGIKSFYIKDDGVSGYKDMQSRIVPSGNKMRKLEFLLADAKKLGFKTVCTVGSAGSNHALETAICAKQVGLETILILNDQRPTSYTIRNLKLMSLFAREVKYCAIDDNFKLMEEAQNLCQIEGYYYIPMGGSNSIGDLGYINAMLELKEQIKSGLLEEPDFIYVTLGSAGTAAGIILGAQVAGIKSKIIPVRISFTVDYKTKLLLDLVNETGKWFKQLEPKFSFAPLDTLNLNIEHNFAGGEDDTYALATLPAAQAIELLAKESLKEIGYEVKLDGTYSGKTFSALLDHATKGLLKNKKVLFWNTFSYGKFENFISCVSDEQINKVIDKKLLHYLTDKLQDLDAGV
ncbi:MAG: pyridoxal-phosphate dependent enzyme [Candidatus Babeliales bacterium]